MDSTSERGGIQGHPYRKLLKYIKSERRGKKFACIKFDAFLIMRLWQKMFSPDKRFDRRK